MSRSLIGPLTREDARLGDWLDAADSLDPTTYRAVVARLARVAADEAVEARALPDACLSVASGHPIGVSVRLAVRAAAAAIRQAERNRERNEAAAALLASGEVPDAPRWEDVRPLLPVKSCQTLDALAAGLLSQSRIWERLASGSVKVNGAIAASALGVSEAGKSKRAVSEQRAAALLGICSAWSDASALLGGMRAGEDPEQRTERAYRWIKRGHSNRQGRVVGASFQSEVRVTRREYAPSVTGLPAGAMSAAGFTAPNDGEPVRTLGYRPVVGETKTTASVAEGVSWGGGGAYGLPSVRSNVADPVTGMVSAKSSAKRRDSDVAAMVAGRVEREDWEGALAAGRVGICPTVDDHGVCDCPRTRTRGKATERVAFRVPVEGPTGVAMVERVAFLHPLAVCERPTEDGRCGCSRKAGALVWVAPAPDADGSLRHASRPARTR